MTIIPLNDRVVIKRLDAESQTATGIALPFKKNDSPDVGVVVAVGPGRRREDGGRDIMQVNVGDKVLFGGYSGFPVPVEGQSYVVVKEEDLLGLVR